MNPDSRPAMRVTVDRQLRVRRVVVADVDQLRTEGSVRRAFDDAYRAALVEQLDIQPVPRRDRPVARRVRRVAPTPTPERLDRHQTRYREAFRPRTRRAGEVTGTSVNGCLSVTVPPAQPRGVIDADPGWLAVTTRSRLGAAITEAFADAYSRRTDS
jgi:hypothetical protein